MTFLSEDFERLKSGKAVFDCRAGCSFSYTTKKGNWKTLHDKQRWRDLVVSAMQVGYLRISPTSCSPSPRRASA